MGQNLVMWPYLTSSEKLSNYVLKRKRGKSGDHLAGVGHR